MPFAGLQQEELEEKYETRTPEDLRLELRYRGQSPDGDREDLIEKLENLRSTQQGRRDDYKRRHAAWYKAKAGTAKPLFPMFTSLPVELQKQIWELSLPGPRLICPSRLPGDDYYLGDRDEGTWPSSCSDSEEDEDGNVDDGNEEEENEDNDDENDDEMEVENDEEGGENDEKVELEGLKTESQENEDGDGDVNDGMLIKRDEDIDLMPHLLTRDFRWMVFHNAHMSHNPAALFVCQLSRGVAKNRYRPCFDRPFLYIDLEIDILYFGPWCYPMWNHVLHWMDRWDFYLSENSTSPPPTYTDMQLVQRIALEFKNGYEFYDAENCEHMTPDMTGKNLRKQLARFPAVKEVVLCETPDLEDVYDFRDWERNVEPHQMTLIKGPVRANPRYSCSSQAEESACNVAGAFERLSTRNGSGVEYIPDVMFARLGLVDNLPDFETFKENPYGNL